MKVAFFAMALLLVAVAMSSVSFPHPATPLTQPQVEHQWQSFLVTFNKTYETRQEFAMRRDVFRRNLISAQKLTAASHRFTRFGVTKFSDMTPAEFKSQVLMNSPPEIDYDLLRSHYEPIDYSSHVAAETKTWVGSGALTPVYNQGQCGSCWAFSATEQMESMRYLQFNKLDRLSMQQIVSCDSQAYGCGGGWTYSAYEYIMSAPGQDSFQTYPYTAANSACEFKPSDAISDISSWKYITQSGDEEEMKNYISSTGPLSICADASSWQFYTGGVLMGSNCGSQIDHCIQLVGYDMTATTPYWIVRNSWGTDWGVDGGYIHLQYGQNTCGVGNVVTTVTSKQM